jgi:hypothetical protein
LCDTDIIDQDIQSLIAQNFLNLRGSSLGLAYFKETLYGSAVFVYLQLDDMHLPRRGCELLQIGNAIAIRISHSREYVIDIGAFRKLFDNPKSNALIRPSN